VPLVGRPFVEHVAAELVVAGSFGAALLIENTEILISDLDATWWSLDSIHYSR